MSTIQPPKIAIVGAGPTGCMLARLLLHLSASEDITPPTIHIFESESSPNYRAQGGTLDLHPKTGLAAIQAAGLFDKFCQKARYDGDCLQITDKDLRVYMSLAPSAKPNTTTSSSNDTSSNKSSTSPTTSSAHGEESSNSTGNKIAKSVSGARPEIDRGDLRQILAESLPPSTIHWNKKLKRVFDDPCSRSNKKSLEFTTGETLHNYDLVIGADGAWSRTRSSHLSSQTPLPAKIAMFDLSIPSPSDKTAPKIHSLINKGNLFAYHTNQFVAIQTMSDGTINIYVQWVLPSPSSSSSPTNPSPSPEETTQTAAPENWLSTSNLYFPSDPDLTRRALVEGPFKDWHPLIKEAILSATARCTPRTLYQLPVGFTWAHKPGVTLIGDAAHLMTPYAGEGVNVGLMDSLVLSRNLISAIKQIQSQSQKTTASRSKNENSGEEEEEEEKRRAEQLDKAIKEYELEMWPRSAKIAKLTDELKELWMFTEGAPGSVIARTTSLHATKDAPRVWHPVIRACVYGYFWGRRVVWGY